MSFVLPDAIPEKLLPIQWLAPHFMTHEGEAIASIQAFIVESQGKRIIVDTCLGNDKKLPIRRWANRKGPFLEDLAARRVPAPEHRHGALHAPPHGSRRLEHHARSATNGSRLFPNAQYLFGRIEWEHWDRTRENWTPTIIEESIQPILDARLHKLVETDHRITDEVWLEPTPGHTPGHVSVRIESNGEQAIITGDLMHHPCQIAHPEWNSVADVDPQQACVTRHAFVTQRAEKGELVIGTHFAAPVAGHIVRDGEGYRFRVLSCSYSTPNASSTLPGRPR